MRCDFLMILSFSNGFSDDFLGIFALALIFAWHFAVFGRMDRPTGRWDAVFSVFSHFMIIFDN